MPTIHVIGFEVQTKSEIMDMDNNNKIHGEQELKIIEKLKDFVEKEPEDMKDQKSESEAI